MANRGWEIREFQGCILKVSFVPAQDDGYGSWDKDTEYYQFHSCMHPEIRKTINEVLERKEVRDKLQKPVFRLYAVLIQELPLQVGLEIKIR